MAARIRAGRPNPLAPAWKPTLTSSLQKNGAGLPIPSNFLLILPHDLSIRRYTKKTERYHRKSPNL